MLRLSRLRTCQSAEAFKPASDAPDSVDAAMSFVLAVGFPRLYEIEAYVGLGRTDKALELLESLPEWLDLGVPESEGGREEPLLRFRRLDVEKCLWYVRIWLRRGEVKKAKEPLSRALKLLMDLPDLSVRDVREDMAIWRVLAFAETVKHRSSLNREPTELPVYLALNLRARKVVEVLVEEIPAHSAHDEPRIMEASAQLDCNRAELLLRTAEDGAAIDTCEMSTDEIGRVFLDEEEMNAPSQAALRLCRDALHSLDGVLDTPSEQRRVTPATVAIHLGKAKLLMVRAKAHQSLGNREAAIDSYGEAYGLLEKAAPYKCPESVELLLKCSYDWIVLEGALAEFAPRGTVLETTCLHLIVLHEHWRHRMVTAEVCRLVKLFDLRIRVTGLFPRWDTNQQIQWAETCDTLGQSD